MEKNWENNSEFLPVIGMEIHVQLKTATKMFCSCSADIWKKEPNSQTCPTCLGLPGALPTINQKAVEQVIKMGLALNCQINEESYFERKNYFYPDLPKGYQISQLRKPLCLQGRLPIGDRKIGISDIHLEEDTGKSLHGKDQKGQDCSFIDFNKSGIPLMEIVSQPEISSAQEAVAYCKRIQQIVRCLGISDGDIEKGQMRFEVNISLRKKDETGLPDYRVEIKNLNSFRFVERVIEYEIKRQSKLLQQGEKVLQETRGLNEEDFTTFSQRSKENAHDYRYFPEPDLPVMEFSQEQIENWKKEIPELPFQIEKRLQEEDNLSSEQAEILVAQPEWLNYYQKAVEHGVISSKVAKIVINQPELMDQIPPEKLKDYLEKEKASQIGDTEELSQIIKKVIEANETAVKDFRQGKETALRFLMGQVMKETRGKADPRKTTEIIQQILG